MNNTHRTERALCQLRFNKPLTETPSTYSVFYSRFFATLDAECIADGNCYKNPMHVFVLAVPPGGELVTFVGIGINTQYVQFEKFIVPGINTAWLVALEEPAEMLSP